MSQRQKGFSIVEYGLILALIGVVATLAYIFLGQSIVNLFQRVVDNFNLD